MHLHMICKMADSLNAITDATTAAGANQIGGITFSVSDTKQQEVRDGLVTAAIADASSKADKLASNLGVKVVGVQTASVSEGHYTAAIFTIYARSSSFYTNSAR